MKSLCVPACILSLSIVSLFHPAPTTAQEPIQHAPDGGTREHVDSIEIPPIPNAPFSATVVTEIAHILPDGSKRITSNQRLVARDTSGRVFQERRFIAPNGITKPTPVQQLQFEDPNQHLMYLCSPASTCSEYPYTRPFVPLPSSSSLPPLVKLRNGNTIRNEDLGRATMQNVDVVGSRETITYNAGTIGNEKPEDVVKEFWYSPRLGINLSTRRDDPRISAIQTFTITKLDLSEPDPKLFALPGGSTIILYGPQ
jgi:hypothetical protein